MVSRPKIETGNPTAVTPASSAYWAARLNERKHAEEALQEECAELRKRVDQQAAQLDVLSQALRQEGGERKRFENFLLRCTVVVLRVILPRTRSRRLMQIKAPTKRSVVNCHDRGKLAARTRGKHRSQPPRRRGPRQGQGGNRHGANLPSHRDPRRWPRQSRPLACSPRTWG